jgi:IclR family transcriptional regulator, KDG regulon repressor
MAIQDDDVVKSVGRVFEVLQLFDQRRESLNATQVERSLGYPQSSTLALLKSMVKLGYLSFDRLERTYLPTMRVASLGHWLEASFHGEGHLAALLDEVSTRTSETVCLSCQNDLVMQFTHVRLAGQGLILNVTAGDFAPLFQSAIGLAALSDRPEPAIRKLAQRHNRRARNPAEKIDPEAVLQRIRRVRTIGYAVGYDMYMSGIGAIAWVLRPEAGPYSVVLSVGGPSDRVKSREASIIRTTRAAIRAHLGA